MAKILTLLPKEAQQLRDQLLQLYKTDTAKDFTPVTYLGAYDNLRAFILSKLKDIAEAEASITVYRLRKLFYYTNPTFCSTDKLEDLSFGSDFITPLLNLFSEQNAREKDGSNVKMRLTKSKPIKYFVIGIVLALTLITYLFSNFKKPFLFRDDFNFNSIADLKTRGWEIIDFDSSLFFPQDTGVLTLRSSRGDYWVQAGDTPKINNVILMKIPDLNCFEVTTKFQFHNNIENWQQCGIIFLNESLCRTNNIRATYMCRDQNAEINRGFQVIVNDHGEVTQPQKFGMEGIRKYDTTNYNFYLRVIKNDSDYSILTHVDDYGFEPRFNAEFHFKPRYIALVAFNAQRDSPNGPLNTASTIPAKFDWIKIKECE